MRLFLGKRFHSGEDLNEVEHRPKPKRRKLIKNQKQKKRTNTFDQYNNLIIKLKFLLNSRIAKDRPHSKTNKDLAPLSNPGLLQGHTDNAVIIDNDAALVSPIVRTPRLENVHQQNVSSSLINYYPISLLLILIFM